jgi:hypothetical protein
MFSLNVHKWPILCDMLILGPGSCYPDSSVIISRISSFLNIWVVILNILANWKL